MNQNEKSSSSAHRIKSLNQISLTHNNKSKESPVNYNFRRRNSQNTYNFSINKPLSPLTSHSSFLLPSGSNKLNGESSETFIKSKLSRESFKNDDSKISPPPPRINTEKSFFLKEDGHSFSNRHNKRSNSLNSNSNSIKNETYNDYSNYNNMKIPVNYNSMDSYNNAMEESNNDVPILSQNVRKSPRSLEVTNLGLVQNNNNNNTTIGGDIPKHNNKIGSTPHSLTSTPYMSHHQFLHPTRTPAQPEKKSSILLSGRYSTYYDNPSPSENTLKIQRYSPTSTHTAGWILLFVTYCVFIIGMYSVVFSRFMSDTGNPVIIKKYIYI